MKDSKHPQVHLSPWVHGEGNWRVAGCVPRFKGCDATHKVVPLGSLVIDRDEHGNPQVNHQWVESTATRLKVSANTVGWVIADYLDALAAAQEEHE